MDEVDKLILSEAVKSARSPKMALDGVKLLCGPGPFYSEIFKDCLDVAWDDAVKFNMHIERWEGIPRRPDRVPLNDEDFEYTIDKISKSRKALKELGDCFALHDEETIKRLYQALVDRNIISRL